MPRVRHPTTTVCSRRASAYQERNTRGRVPQRLRFLQETTLLAVDDRAHELKTELLRHSQIPAAAGTDALHIAIATVHGIEYLVTWNCRHIANAVTLPSVYDVCRSFGYEPPLVCTPYELLGENDEELI